MSQYGLPVPWCGRPADAVLVMRFSPAGLPARGSPPSSMLRSARVDTDVFAVLIDADVHGVEHGEREDRDGPGIRG